MTSMEQTAQNKPSRLEEDGQKTVIDVPVNSSRFVATADGGSIETSCPENISFWFYERVVSQLLQQQYLVSSQIYEYHEFNFNCFVFSALNSGI